MAGSGFIVSESTPGLSNRYVWYKPSTREYYELNAFGDAWVLCANEPDGLTGDYEGTIKKIKVERGLVTEIELE